jgi:ubiquinone/menaquinone biosynthesis C-methylase UbiE
LVKEIARLKYNATASGYDELYRLEQLEKYKAVFVKLNLKLSGKLVLDDGCGTALLLEYLVETRNLPIYYICLDLSNAMLVHARVRARSLLQDHMVELVEADAENLPLRDASVDYVLSFTVFMLLEDPGRGVMEATRVGRELVLYTVPRKLAHRIPVGTGVGLIGDVGKDVAYVRYRARR